MNKRTFFYAALLPYGNRAEAKEIKGKVMADGKGLAKLVNRWHRIRSYQ